MLFLIAVLNCRPLYEEIPTEQWRVCKRSMAEDGPSNNRQMPECQQKGREQCKSCCLLVGSARDMTHCVAVLLFYLLKYSIFATVQCLYHVYTIHTCVAAGPIHNDATPIGLTSILQLIRIQEASSRRTSLTSLRIEFAQ